MILTPVSQWRRDISVILVHFCPHRAPLSRMPLPKHGDQSMGESTHTRICSIKALSLRQMTLECFWLNLTTHRTRPDQTRPEPDETTTNSQLLSHKLHHSLDTPQTCLTSLSSVQRKKVTTSTKTNSKVSACSRIPFFLASSLFPFGNGQPTFLILFKPSHTSLFHTHHILFYLSACSRPYKATRLLLLALLSLAFFFLRLASLYFNTSFSNYS